MGGTVCKCVCTFKGVTAVRATQLCSVATYLSTTFHSADFPHCKVYKLNIDEDNERPVVSKILKCLVLRELVRTFSPSYTMLIYTV